MSSPRLIFGLGNPGPVYEATRHNIGARVIQSLAHFYQSPLKLQKNLGCAVSLLEIEGQSVIFARSLGFMNLSGEALFKLASSYKVSLQDIVVIHDDIRLDFGSAVWQDGGPLRGQNGLKSITSKFKSDQFLRLRLGIANAYCHSKDEHFQEKMSGFVLSPFSSAENSQLEIFISNSRQLIQKWLNDHTKENFYLPESLA